MEPSDRKTNWFKSLTRRKKSSSKENNQNVNIDTSVSAIPSVSTESAFNRQSSTTNSNSSQSQTSSTISSNVLSWVTMFRKRAQQRRRDLNADLVPGSSGYNHNCVRVLSVANDYVVGLPNLDIPLDQMYIYSHILTPQQQHNFVMSRVTAMTNQIESPWLIPQTSPNMEPLIMLNAQVLMNK